MPKKTPSGGDKIVSMAAEVNVDTGEIIFTDQSEIEDLALAVLDATKDIFYDEIPIGDNVILEFDDNYFRGWVLKTLNSDCI